MTQPVAAGDKVHQRPERKYIGLREIGMADWHLGSGSRGDCPLYLDKGCIEHLSLRPSFQAGLEGKMPGDACWGA
jgi:hypothetical protein